MSKLGNDNSGTDTALQAIIAEDDANAPTSGQALQLSGNLYRRLFETTRDGILLLNAET